MANVRASTPLLHKSHVRGVPHAQPKPPRPTVLPKYTIGVPPSDRSPAFSLSQVRQISQIKNTETKAENALPRPNINIDKYTLHVSGVRDFVWGGFLLADITNRYIYNKNEWGAAAIETLIEYATSRLALELHHWSSKKISGWNTDSKEEKMADICQKSSGYAVLAWNVVQKASEKLAEHYGWSPSAATWITSLLVGLVEDIVQFFYLGYGLRKYDPKLYAEWEFNRKKIIEFLLGIVPGAVWQWIYAFFAEIAVEGVLANLALTAGGGLTIALGALITSVASAWVAKQINDLLDDCCGHKEKPDDHTVLLDLAEKGQLTINGPTTNRYPASSVPQSTYIHTSDDLAPPVDHNPVYAIA